MFLLYKSDYQVADAAVNTGTMYVEQYWDAVVKNFERKIVLTLSGL